jgi:hypothetical protein
MLYITVDCGSVQEEWDLHIYDRVVRGLKNLEKEGFTVERFDQAEVKTQKRIITITRGDARRRGT